MRWIYVILIFVALLHPFLKLKSIIPIMHPHPSLSPHRSSFLPSILITHILINTSHVSPRAKEYAKKTAEERAADRNRRYAYSSNRLFPSCILTHPFHLIDHPSCHPFLSLISSSTLPTSLSGRKSTRTRPLKKEPPTETEGTLIAQIDYLFSLITHILTTT